MGATTKATVHIAERQVRGVCFLPQQVVTWIPAGIYSVGEPETITCTERGQHYNCVARRLNGDSDPCPWYVADLVYRRELQGGGA